MIISGGLMSDGCS